MTLIDSRAKWVRCTEVELLTHEHESKKNETSVYH